MNEDVGHPAKLVADAAPDDSGDEVGFRNRHAWIDLCNVARLGQAGARMDGATALAH